MPKNNPMNPHSQDEQAIQRHAPLAVMRATVTDAFPKQDDESGPYHRVTVRVYGDPSPHEATVLAPSRGDVNVPTVGDDVAVAFGPNEKPFIIGYWYPANKVQDGRVDLPDYEPGERIIGTPHNTSFISISKDGTITIKTEDDAPVNIDHNSFVAYMGSDQSVAGDGNYYILEYDTEEDDPEGLFDPSTYTFTVKHAGRYEVGATAEIAAAGQNVLYQIAVFVNGSQEKRKSRQSAVNEPISLDVELSKNLSEGDEVDVRLAQNSGPAKTVQGSSITTDFSAERQGI